MKAPTLALALVAACAPNEGPRLADFNGLSPGVQNFFRLKARGGTVVELEATVVGPRHDQALVVAVDAPDNLVWDAFAWKGALDLTDETRNKIRFDLVVYAEGLPLFIANDYPVEITVRHPAGGATDDTEAPADTDAPAETDAPADTDVDTGAETGTDTGTDSGDTATP